MYRSKTFMSAVPFLFVFFWSTGFVGARWGLPYIEPFNFLFLRMLITLVAFLALILWFKAEWPSLRGAGHQLVVGSLIHATYLGGVFTAIKLELPAGVAAIIVGLQPLLIAILSFFWFGQRVSRLGWIGLWLGLFGVILVLSTGLFKQGFVVHPVAIIAVLISLVSISVGTLYQKRFGGGTNLLTASFIQYVATAILMGLMTFSFETRIVEWNPQVIGALLWLVFGLSVTAILLLLLMIREGESAKVASYFYLVPPAAALEAWLLFDEKIAPLGLLGIALAVAGVYVTQRAMQRRIKIHSAS